MKVKAKHLIPVYGPYIYFKEYYTADKRTAKEAEQASWMFMYEIFGTGLAVLFLLKLVLLLVCKVP